jgi:ferrochelatase
MIDPNRDAVLLICHGTVSSLDDVPGFLANIRRGRPAPPEMVKEIQHRLEAIGGSPLMRHTQDQADGLAARLGIPCRVAGRLWDPYPAPALATLAAEGRARVLSLPLAPQSVHVYNAAVRAAAKEAAPSLEIVDAPAWGDEPALIDAFVETVHEGLARAAAVHQGAASETAVVLSAHSLPMRALQAGDPYEKQFRAMAELVAERFRGTHPVAIAFQSQGMTDDAWLGPDLPTTFRRLKGEGVRAVVVAPIGFLAEHVETLYDLDVDAPKLAAEVGVAFARAPAPCARPRLVDALEVVARGALG